jgi:outer membrane lipoprotein-sorting protein
MDPNDSAHTTEEAGGLSTRRRKAARYAVPVAVAGVAAATIGLVPALAASGDPDLPKISAQELVERIAASDTERLSGMVKIETDLGLPGLGDLGESLGAGLGSAGDHGGGRDDEGPGAGSSADPASKLPELITGDHTLRIAVDGPDRQKVSVLGKAAEYSLIRNGDEVWGYDSASNEVFHAKEPAGTHRDAGDGKPGKPGEPEKGELPSTPAEFAEEALKAAGDTTSVTVDGTARVAGRSAYQLVIKPKQSGSTIGSVKVAVDSATGTPLRFTLLSSGGGKPVVDVGFTKVDFGKPAAGTFDFTPPKGARVTEADELEKAAEKAGGRAKGGAGKHGTGLPGPFGEFGNPDGLKDLKIIGEGWTAIAKAKGAGGGFALPEEGELPREAEAFLGSLGDRVNGKFGSGTVFKTRLVNALITEDGTVYAGAVTKDALVKAANADR